VLDLGLPKKIAVTGGIASGKSTVCRLFEELGAYYVSADEIVHQLLLPTTTLGKEIIALLGGDIVVDGALSRKRIAQKVFSDSHLLDELEKRIHPEVQRVIEAKYKAASHDHVPLFVAEVPLLFEAGLESNFDAVIVVVSDEKECRKRFQHDENEYRRRSQRLMPIQEKIKKAHYVIENSGSLDHLRQTIQPLFFALKETI
jgi:dephospho-CoA kinase